MIRATKAGLHISALALLPLVATVPAAYAEWSGGLEAGTQLGSGENPTLRFFARHSGEPMNHYLYLDWTKEDSGHSYRLGYNPVFNVSRSLYSFGKFSVEEDANSVVDQEINALVGLGNNIHRTRESLLTIEVGGGAQQLKFDGGPAGEREDETQSFIYIGAKYHRILFDSFRFNTIVDSRTGDLQDTIDAEVGISFRLSAATALKYAYRYQRTDFEDGNLDTQVEKDGYFTLTYGF